MAIGGSPHYATAPHCRIASVKREGVDRGAFEMTSPLC
jgi:hypothetical protein